MERTNSIETREGRRPNWTRMLVALVVGFAVVQWSVGPLMGVLRPGASEEDRPNYAQLGTPLFRGAEVQAALQDGTWTYARNAPAEEIEEAEESGRRRRLRPGSPGAEYLFDRRIDTGENVNLVERVSRVQGRIRTFERGVEGETQACGSGSMASVIAMFEDGRGEADVTLRVTGGDPLDISISPEAPLRRGEMSSIGLAGPAVRVYDGHYPDD